MPSLATLKLIGWGVIAFAFIACLAALRLEQAHSAKLSAQLHECSTLRHADWESYVRAQTEAQAKNNAHVAQIEQHQAEITHEVSSDYARQLADLRSRLRPQAAPAAPGSAGGAQAPGVPEASSGADGDGLLVSPSDRLHASEVELRLLYLQKWIEGQGGVNPN
jgi:hypothetical protein